MAAQEVHLAFDPVEVAQRLRHQPYSFVLDGGGRSSWGWGRALFGWRPAATLHVDAEGQGVVAHGGQREQWRGNPLELLERFCGRTRAGATPEPFAGGVLVALSYDLHRWIERRRGWRKPRPGSLVLYAAAYDELLSYDYATGRYWTGGARSRGGAGSKRVAGDLEGPPPPPAFPPGRVRLLPGPGREDHAAAVSAALAYIAAGDIYQVNLSQRFLAVGVQPGAVYAAMRRQHPMPFSAYVDCGELQLISASPECLFFREGRRLATFPIKGTRPRSAEVAQDRRLAAELLSDGKEMAEHVMIVDLERNDLGRICKTGSVRVDWLARLRSFASLHHLESKISGEIEPEVSTAEVLRALFPGGSITGAPKIRAMEIIEQLEPVDRGFYTGSIGFLDDCGRASFSIAIRTVVAAGGCLAYHAGGGIVADSDPAREYDEILLKAHPFFSALRAEAA